MATSIYVKLASVQDKLFVPKTQENKHGHYNYRSCEDILVAVKPLLREVGLVLVLIDEIIEIGGRNYVDAEARLIDTESGATYSAHGYAREAETQSGMSAGQLTGATSSYARKYALNGLFAIDNTKDLDTEEFQRASGQIPANPAPVAAKQDVLAKVKEQQAQAPAQPDPKQYTDEFVLKMATGESLDFAKKIITAKSAAEIAKLMSDAKNANKDYYSGLRDWGVKHYNKLIEKEKVENHKK